VLSSKIDQIFEELRDLSTFDRHVEIAKHEPNVQLELLLRFQSLDAMQTKKANTVVTLSATTSSSSDLLTVLEGSLDLEVNNQNRSNQDQNMLIGGLMSLLVLFVAVVGIAIQYARRNHEIHRPDYEMDQHGKPIFTTTDQNSNDPEWDGMDLDVPAFHRQFSANVSGWSAKGLFRSAFGTKGGTSKRRIKGLQDPPITMFPLPAVGGILGRGMSGFGFGPAAVNDVSLNDDSYGGLVGGPDAKPDTPDTIEPYSPLGAKRPFSPFVYRPINSNGTPTPAYSRIDDRLFDVAGLYSKPRPNIKGMAAGLRSLPPLPPSTETTAAYNHGDNLDSSASETDENIYNFADRADTVVGNGGSVAEENMYNVAGVGGVATIVNDANLRPTEAVYNTAGQSVLEDPFYDNGGGAATNNAGVPSWDWAEKNNGNESETYATAPEETYATTPEETYASASYASAPSEVSSGVYASIPELQMDDAPVGDLSDLQVKVNHPAPAYSQIPTRANDPAAAAEEDEEELVIVVDPVVDEHELRLNEMRSEVCGEMDNISTDGISLDGILIGAMDDHVNNEFSMFVTEDDAYVAEDDAYVDGEMNYDTDNYDIIGGDNDDGNDGNEGESFDRNPEDAAVHGNGVHAEESFYNIKTGAENDYDMIITTWPTDNDVADMPGLLERRLMTGGSKNDGSDGIIEE